MAKKKPRQLITRHLSICRHRRQLPPAGDRAYVSASPFAFGETKLAMPPKLPYDR